MPTHDTHVDTDYRFAIDSPGPEWELLDEARSQIYAPGALAAAVRKWVHLYVFVAPTNGRSLEDYADQPGMQMDGAATLAGHECLALQSVEVGRDEPVRGRTSSRALIHQGHCYTVVVSAFTRPGGASIESVFGVFRLLEGEVVARTLPQVDRSTHGSAWIIRDHVYENVEIRPGFAISGTPDTFFFCGPELVWQETEAVVTTARGSDSLEVSVSREPLASQATDEEIRARLDLGAVDGTPEHRTFVCGGDEHPFRCWTEEGKQNYESTWIDADSVWIVDAAHDVDDANARAAVAAVLAAIEPLSPERSKEVERQLADLEPHRAVLAEHAVWRSRTYVDYAANLAWKIPSHLPVTAAALGDIQARDETEVAAVHGCLPSLGLYFTLTPSHDHSPSPSAYHAKALRTHATLFEGPRTSGPTRELEHATGTVWTTTIESEVAAGLREAVSLATFVHGGNALELVLHGPASAFAARPDDVDRVLTGLTAHDAQEREQTDGTFLDRRLGLAIDLRDGLEVRAPEPSECPAGEFVFRLLQDGEVRGYLAATVLKNDVPTPLEADRAYLCRLTEFVTGVPTTSAESGSWVAATFEAAECQHYDSGAFNCLALQRGSTHFLLTTSSGQQREELAARLQLFEDPLL